MRAEPENAVVQQFLSFVVADGDCAVPILEVREILQFEGVTPVPGAPRAVRGVINLRGSVVPVVDVAVKFGRPEIAPTRWTCVVVVEARLGEQRTLVGLLADSVREVLELRAEEIEPPPALGNGARTEYVVGMGKLGKGFVLLIDVDRLLSAEEKLVEPAEDAPPPAPEPAPAEAAGGAAA
jgi:purine-binding chemotaxis protein CheW